MNESDEGREDQMNCGLSVAEHDLLRERLRDLRDTVPPRAVWERIESQARAEGLFRPKFAGRSGWMAGLGVAAAIVLAVMVLPSLPGIEDGPEEFPTTPAFEEPTNAGGLTALNALMVESRQIERDLRALPEQPSLIRASTAATISELEDRIAAIDYVLNHPDVELTEEQSEIYWRERVRLMNSLLRLRTAQTQRMSF